MPLPKDPVMNKLIGLAQERGMTLSAFATAAGLNKDTLTRTIGRGGTPSMETLRKIAAWLGVPVNDLLASGGPFGETTAKNWRNREIAPAPVKRPAAESMRRDLPVRGTAAGSAVNGFEISPNIIEYVRRPPALESVLDAYAIQVVGESMSPLHRPGDLCFLHPHRFHRRGDSVVIQLKAHDGAPIEAYIKTFKRETQDEIIVEQLNPKAEIRYKKNTILSVHKVLTMSELFGI
ncbi:S24 family peptidase [Rhodoblastus sp. 17X3]|uniref:XRE family transcriptional regulator n=1 Tax=Rhodoblastus sp. 17X3 TaxID=3047026 RepID=UPI0024B82C81|nr:S24 family peptidase [Rhodoblastus sp. 17X3]MDI9847342.1 S24 family peptidase [Rhodoblastus sp. 17X3]